MLKKFMSYILKAPMLLLPLVAAMIIFVNISLAQNENQSNQLVISKLQNFDTFKKIPVLNQGRIKPLDTYAMNFLLQLSGKRHYMKEPAIQWFARFSFTPKSTYDDKVFLINNPEILEAINVEPDKNRRYSYNQLEKGFEKIKELAMAVDKIESKERSVVEQETMRLYVNLYQFMRLSGVFAWGSPHSDFNINSNEIKTVLQFNDNQTKFSFYDIYSKTSLIDRVASILNMKDRKQWSNSDKEITKLINSLFRWTEEYANIPFGLIPTASQIDEQWLSPMDIIRTNSDDPAYMAEIRSIRDMAIHFQEGDVLEFNVSVKTFLTSIQNRLSSQEKKAVNRIPLELFYNNLNLFTWSKLFYGFGFLIFLLSLLSENRILYPITAAFTLFGFIPHFIALILRIIIMSRPPVSNLYETFIFVGLIGAILGLILELNNRNSLGLAIANICGLIFLFIAGKFSNDGDTMQMLVAVLNSNFWLSTHVISITIGYAGCCVAGVIGHIYILQAFFLTEKSNRLESTFKSMLGILGFGLIMTFLGTALGGIWADQSWGRFWGWDPKENGALLIVLWCAIIFHARLAKLIHPLGVAVGCVLGLIVVMWAWFGVNLLSIGLHSYGFTSGIANALIIYVLLEVLFIAVTVLILGRRNIKI